MTNLDTNWQTMISAIEEASDGESLRTALINGLTILEQSHTVNVKKAKPLIPLDPVDPNEPVDPVGPINP